MHDSPPGALSPTIPSHSGLLVTYVPLGDPVLDDGTLLDRYSTFEPDILELGLASPQPYLDGPTIAASMQRSFSAAFSVRHLIERVCEWRERADSSSQVVWMCYASQDLSLLDEAVQRRAIDGLLMVDFHTRPDCDDIERQLTPTALGLCGFLGWNTSYDEARAVERSRGYVMVQSRPGVTGATGSPNDHAGQGPDISGVTCPLVSGFGIRTRDDIERVAGHGYDGVVVGTACVDALHIDTERLVEYGQDLRTWVDAAFGDGEQT